MSIHESQFHRNRVSGNFRALCTCGWCRIGRDEAEVRGLAATHDIEWIAVEAPVEKQPADATPAPFWTDRQ